MTRRNAANSGLSRPADAAPGSRSVAAGIFAIVLAVSLGGCSDVWSKFTSGPSSDTAAGAATDADDDTKCQSAGYQYGTPEYSQCREGLASKRTVARDLPLGPTSAPTR
jgi:uncharacterized protein YceK